MSMRVRVIAFMMAMMIDEGISIANLSARIDPHKNGSFVGKPKRCDLINPKGVDHVVHSLRKWLS